MCQRIPATPNSRLTRLRAWLEATPPGYRVSRGRLYAVLAGVMATLTLSALDQAIVSTALPRMSADLGDVSAAPWVFTAYMLASTVTIPLVGKLGDLKGRKPFVLGSISIFVAGSVACGLASSMWLLIAFRAVQGLGAGGIQALSFAIYGNLVPARNRARYQGFIGSVFVCSSIGGPILGGLIVDNTSWRWIFLLNAPIGAVALVIVSLAMVSRPRHRHASVDWTGAALLALGAGSGLLCLTWGGHQYSWVSREVILCFATSATTITAFVVHERHARAPLVPLELARDRTVATSAFAMLLTGATLFGLLAYVPLFVQTSLSRSAAASSVGLIPFFVAVFVTSTLCGQLISWIGRYKLFAVAGPCIQLVGFLLLTRIGPETPLDLVIRDTVICGCGLGIGSPVMTLIAQNAVPAREIGLVTALTQFARATGATAGVAVMGAILNANVKSFDSQKLAAGEHLSATTRLAVADGMQLAFVAPAVLAAAVAVVLAIGIREVPLRRDFDDLEIASATVPR